MQQLSGKTLEEIIEAIKTVEELKKVYTVLSNYPDNTCKPHALSRSEANEFGIDRASLISVILAMYKLKKD